MNIQSYDALKTMVTTILSLPPADAEAVFRGLGSVMQNVASLNKWRALAVMGLSSSQEIEHAVYTALLAAVSEHNAVPSNLQRVQEGRDVLPEVSNVPNVDMTNFEIDPNLVPPADKKPDVPASNDPAIDIASDFGA